MTALARSLSDSEARAAASFWATQMGGPHIRVIETEQVPIVRLQGNLYVVEDISHHEPILGRIIEAPTDPAKSEDLDDPRFGYVAYVPAGSVARGRELATQGVDTGTSQPDASVACALCHGAGLHGMGEAPPIAGRSPSYLVRQLYDFKTGARNGALSALMTPVAARLSTSQMTDLAAYIATMPTNDDDVP